LFAPFSVFVLMCDHLDPVHFATGAVTVFKIETDTVVLIVD